MTTISHIPTTARAKVRAFVRALPGFDTWIAQRGIDSRNVLNKHLLAYAAEMGRMDDVAKIIGMAAAAPAPAPSKSLRGMLEESVAIEAAMVEPEHTVPAAFAPDEFSTDAILAGVEQFLSPVVRRTLVEGLTPVVAAANKPAIEKVVERIVEVGAPLQAPAGAAPYALKTGRKVSAGQLFGFKVKQDYAKAELTLWDAHGAAPHADPFYVVDPLNVTLLATAIEHGTNVWLVGPSGSGKTTMPEQVCAALNRPFVKIGFTKQTDVSDLVGNPGFREGATVWEDGALIAAMRRPGTVILLDEPTIAPAGVQAIIQGVTDDHRSYTVHATGEVVKCASGVVFVAADNTNGTGDESGQYAGTNQANAALVNRFKRMVRVEYLTIRQETEALVNHTGIPADAAQHVVEFFAKARKLPEMEGVVMSLRQMTGFVNTVKDGFDSATALQVAVLNKLPATERAAVQTLATLDWSRRFTELMGGKPEQVAGAPSTSRAATAFDDDVSQALTA